MKSTETFLNQHETSELLGLSTRELRSIERKGNGPACMVLNRKTRRYPLTGVKLFLATRLHGVRLSNNVKK